MRNLIVAVSMTTLFLAAISCQGDAGPSGEQGPPGPHGPAGSAADVASVIEQIQEQSDGDLSLVRSQDSERLDTLIHLIIENTGNPEFKARLQGLDREIYRVFENAAAAAPDDETVQTFELMEGIVVVASIIDAIAEARLGAMQPAQPDPAPAKHDADNYTKYFVTEAISKNDAEGLEPLSTTTTHKRILTDSGTCSSSTKTT